MLYAGVLPPQVRWRRGLSSWLLPILSDTATRNRKAPPKAVSAQVRCHPRGGSIAPQPPRCLISKLCCDTPEETRPRGVSRWGACPVPVAAVPAWKSAGGASGSAAAEGASGSVAAEGASGLVAARGANAPMTGTGAPAWAVAGGASVSVLRFSSGKRYSPVRNLLPEHSSPRNERGAFDAKGVAMALMSIP